MTSKAAPQVLRAQVCLMPNYKRRQAGFTYLGLIILVTIIGLVAASALQVGAITQRRQAEQELLAIGGEYIAALKSYAAATPAGLSTLPVSLDDLLSDPRYPNIRRHLRRVFIDPLTGRNEWGLVQGTVGSGTGIVGIYSLSEARPVKVDNFDLMFAGFKDKKSYHDWVFTAQSPQDENSAPSPPASVPNGVPLGNIKK